MSQYTLTCANPGCRLPLGRVRTETGRLTKARHVRVQYDRRKQVAHLQCPACETVRAWRVPGRATTHTG